MKKPGWKRSVLKFVVKVSRGGGWTKRSVVSKEGEVFCGGEGRFSVEGKGGKDTACTFIIHKYYILVQKASFQAFGGEMGGLEGSLGRRGMRLGCPL